MAVTASATAESRPAVIQRSTLIASRLYAPVSPLERECVRAAEHERLKQRIARTADLAESARDGEHGVDVPADLL